MKMLGFASACCLATLLTASHAPALSLEKRAFHWPKPVAESLRLNLNSLTTAGVSFEIKTAEGSVEYWGGCRGLNFKGKLGDPAGDEDSDYYGDFDCHLHSVHGETNPALNLLVDEASDPVENFGRMVTNEANLKGLCATYPEWGRLRHVRLRGMNLTFEFAQIKSGAMQLVITVGPDPTALSAIAEPPAFQRPQNELCGHPIPVHVPGQITAEYTSEHHLEPPFPEIVSTNKTEEVTIDRSVAFSWAEKRLRENERVFYLPVEDVAGKLAYMFECSAYVGLNGIDRWGMPCGLFTARDDVNLLADSIDPYSRMSPAQILPDQLFGDCANYPQWGNERTFALRGFELTVRLKHPVFAPGEFQAHALRRVTLTAEITPSSAATSPFALPSSTIYWGLLSTPNPCGTVIVDPGAVSQHN